MASSSRSTSSKSTTPAAKSPHPSYPPPGNNASILIEKTRPGVRRSTPDSEALASSEDEDHQQNQLPAAPVVKPMRRISWINDVPTTLARKASLPTSSSFSSANSNPTTPAADQTSWGGATSPGLNAPLSWGSTGTGPFPWGTAIWNSDARKEPPSRLTEVLQSPTSTMMPSSSTINSGDDILSPLAKTISGDSNIPFSIPLHPTPKTYRSQSYSVGQLDTEQQATLPPNNGAIATPTARRGTVAPLSSIQRRSSRPSMLGELGHDAATLGRVREDEDDGNVNGAEGGYNWSSLNQARRIEQLSLENALLRQAASGQLDNSRFRDRAMSSASATSGFSLAQSHNLHRLPGSVPEEGDLAVEDLDELGEIHPGYNSTRSNGRRRLSEHSTNLDKPFPNFNSLENRALENIKKAHWQTSLGFGGMPEGPQSRRHSFADIPMRQQSLGSPADSHQPVIGPAASMGNREDGFTNFANGGVSASPADNNSSYFPGHDKSLRVSDNIPTSGISTSLHQAYVMPNAFGRQHSNLAHAHQNQQLFIVTFKCGRADVFYIQEDTGLQVKTGDLVIVEADRGTDLGTVAHANVSWARARELKEHYAEEHYKWLMIFSRQSQSGVPNAVNPNSVSSNLNGAPGSAVGGMGPQGQHGMQEPQGGDIKPKLIKRLAQSHEIQTLREKEGNEAKAKRVCQQKVAEHRLNMEILDAEFQMDWKKLTFYYFADTYINFNSLVTDLFKIYKTRIWMSAINPASFVTPTAGLQPPSSIGFTQEGHPDRRRPHDFKPFVPSAGQGVASMRGFADAAARDTTGNLRSQYVDPYQAFASGRQPDAAMPGFSQGVQPQTDPFSSFQPSSYGVGDPNLPDLHNAAGLGPVARQAHPTQGDWMNRFQGLSLGS
ncbi:PSP1 domain-containing protein [Histoplasma capsulatum H143]|uniref:PSP1 domain-containing protein n=1 Tax=Ajellomyces capsulatus (strain H143) TaxID=544712 RepID=C6HAS1_AJECH|nr:PSP1 domain-containing protein [Histoplasma capsulatum H143]